MKVSELFEASLGSRVEFRSRKEWENALPSKRTMHKDGNLERAQALGKDFEGVAGTWDSNKNTGWIYAYYLKKSNLVEAARHRKFYVIMDILEKGKRKTVSVIKQKGFDSREEAEDALKKDTKLSDKEKERCEVIFGANWNDE